MNALELSKKNEHEIKKRFGVMKIGIFGSFAIGEEREREREREGRKEGRKEGSDIDVLVEF